MSELGGSNGVSNNIKYYNLPNDTEIKLRMPTYSTLVKLDSGDMKVLYGVGQIIEMFRAGDSISEFYEYVVSCAVDFDALYLAAPSEGEIKIKDVFTPETVANANLVEITKEEFYNLNA